MFARTLGFPMVVFIAVLLLSLIEVVIVDTNHPQMGEIVFLSAGLAALAAAWIQTKVDPRLLLAGFQALLAVAIVLSAIIGIPLQVVWLWPLAMVKGRPTQLRLLFFGALAWFGTVGCVGRVVYLERKRRSKVGT